MRAKMMKKPVWSYFVISRNSKPQKVVHSSHFQKFLRVNPSKIMFQGTAALKHTPFILSGSA